MASIYKRGRIWWIHYLVGGKSVSRSLRTSNERVALEKKKRLEALEVTGQLPKPSSTPIDDFLQSFCEFLCRTRTRKSAKNDISYLRDILTRISTHPASRIDELTPPLWKERFLPKISLPRLPVKAASRAE